jgi:hypothetical protein
MLKLSPKLILFYAVTLALTGAAIVTRSAAFAFAATAALGVSLVAEAVFEKLLAMRNISLTLSPEDKRKLQDVEARLANIEHGIRTRGY